MGTTRLAGSVCECVGGPGTSDVSGSVGLSGLTGGRGRVRDSCYARDNGFYDISSCLSPHARQRHGLD